MKKSSIKLHSVSKIYTIGENKILTINNINIDIHKEEFTMITGPSGSGKTTLMMIMGLIIPPTSGFIELNNKKIDYDCDDELSTKRLKEIGFIFQQSTLIKALTVMDNLLLPFGINGGTITKEKKDRAYKMLHFFELEQFANELPYELSGGQKQRIAIVRALMNDPLILLCDEPTASLDFENAVIIMDTLESLSYLPNKTVIVTNHDQRFFSRPNRLITIENGKVSQDEHIHD